MNNKGYEQKHYAQPVKRYCQILDLKEDAQLIAAYKCAHSREKAWDEIVEGIRSVGILEMEIYLAGNRAVMIVDAPTDLDWESAMARLATLPRQAEWEDFVSRFQQCLPGSTSAEKWQMMERIFYLYE
jgi:L-rhamnose mutarotase